MRKLTAYVSVKNLNLISIIRTILEAFWLLSESLKNLKIYQSSDHLSFVRITIQRNILIQFQRAKRLLFLK